MTNLSTSSSDTVSGAGTGPWYYRSRDIVATITAVGLLELVLHVGVAQFRIFEPEAGITQRSSFVESAVTRAEKADAIDVVVVGSSIADGIDTEMLSADLGNNATVESFRLVGADSKGTAEMLDTVVFPNLDVGWVVYVVSPHDTNSLSSVEKRNERIPSLEAYANNRFTYKLSRSIEKNLYLYRYRNDIKASIPTLKTLKKALKKGKQSSAPKASPKPYEFASYEAFEEATRFRKDLSYIQQLCEQNGANLIIVTLPTNPESEVTKPAFQQGADVWVASVKAFAEENNLGFIDGFQFIQDESQFRDTHHLSQKGIIPTTQMLKEAISSQ